MSARIVQLAAHIAYAHYGTQRRRYSGEPHFYHSRNVARLLQVVGLPDSVVAAGFVYDLVRYSDVTLDYLGSQLGDECGRILHEIHIPDAPSIHDQWVTAVTQISIPARLVLLAAVCEKLSTFGSMSGKLMGPGTYSEQYLKQTRSDIDTISQSLMVSGIKDSDYYEAFHAMSVVMEHVYTVASNIFDYHTLLKQSRITNNVHRLGSDRNPTESTE